MKLVVGGDRQIFGYSADADCRYFALGISDPVVPGDVTLLDRKTGAEVRLTWENAAFLDGVCLSAPEAVPYQTPDGLDEMGWVMKPAGCVEGKKYPAVLQIPADLTSLCTVGVSSSSFQLLASSGYAVIYAIPAGALDTARISSGPTLEILAGRILTISWSGWIRPYLLASSTIPTWEWQGEVTAGS